MTPEVTWLVNERVVLARFNEHLNLDAVQAVIAQTQEHVEQGVAPVHVISDVTRVKHVEPNLPQLRTVIPVVSPKTGWIVVVVSNTLVRFFSSLMVQFAGGNYRFYPTLNDAVAFLKSIDADIARAIDAQDAQGHSQTD